MPCDRACEFFFFFFFISTSGPSWWDFHRRSRLSAQLNADWRRIASKSGRVYLCKTRSKAVDTRVSCRAEKSATIDGNIPVKGNGRFPPHWSSQIRDQGILGKGGRIYNFWQERWFTNDPIDSTRGEGGIFWNWDNREIFIPANNVPRSLSKHQDSLLSSIIEPGQRNFLIPSNVKRILEFYLAMNHSLRCFLLSSRERKTIKSRFKEPDSRDRIEINARIRWKGWRLAEKRAKLSFISRVLLPREYISPSLSLSLRRESSSALCCAPIKISAVNYAVPRRLLATVRPKTAKIKRTGRNVTCRV